MYKAAEAYFEALQKVKIKEELTALKEELDKLSARYSDNPAYYALIAQKYIEKKAECDKACDR